MVELGNVGFEHSTADGEGIGFSRVVDRMLCHRVRERTRVPARWVTVRRHHKLVRVKKHAHTKLVTVTRCHPRIAHRKTYVWVTVKRRGKIVRVRRAKRIRVVVLPHVVTHTAKRIAHGKSTVVSGWLGMPNGTALGGQTVRVLTAPDNGLSHFSQAAGATTRADGTWRAHVPAGPSRLVEGDVRRRSDARAEYVRAGTRDRSGERSSC